MLLQPADRPAGQPAATPPSIRGLAAGRRQTGRPGAVPPAPPPAAAPDSSPHAARTHGGSAEVAREVGRVVVWASAVQWGHCRDRARPPATAPRWWGHGLQVLQNRPERAAALWRRPHTSSPPLRRRNENNPSPFPVQYSHGTKAALPGGKAPGKVRAYQSRCARARGPRLAAVNAANATCGRAPRAARAQPSHSRASPA